MLKTVLLDTDREFMDLFIKYTIEKGRIMVVGAAISGDIALELIVENWIDIVIIDLNMPGYDGQYVLDRTAFIPGHKPMFITLASKTARNIAESKTNYFLPKPRHVNQLYEQTLKIWESRACCKNSENEFAQEMTCFPKKPKQQTPELYISNLLRKLGIPFHLQGTAYLCSAFKIAIEKGVYQSGDFTNIIYPKVAKIYNTNPQHVERCIRYMTNRTMERGRDLIITNHLEIPMISPGKRLTVSALLTALMYCYNRDKELIPIPN